MKMTISIDVTKNAGPSVDWQEVAEMIEDEMPTEVWVDETDYQIEVLDISPAK